MFHLISEAVKVRLQFADSQILHNVSGIPWDVSVSFAEVLVITVSRPSKIWRDLRVVIWIFLWFLHQKIIFGIFFQRSSCLTPNLFKYCDTLYPQTRPANWFFAKLAYRNYRKGFMTHDASRLRCSFAFVEKIALINLTASFESFHVFSVSYSCLITSTSRFD